MGGRESVNLDIACLTLLGSLVLAASRLLAPKSKVLVLLGSLLTIVFCLLSYRPVLWTRPSTLELDILTEITALTLLMRVSLDQSFNHLKILKVVIIVAAELWFTF